MLALTPLRTLALLLAAAATPPRDDLPDSLPACLHSATAANFSHDLDRQRELLEHAEALDGRPADTAAVQRQLAVLDWKYEQADDQARARLQRAVSGPEPGRAWLALVRLEYARGRYGEALRAARQAVEVGEKHEVRRLGRLAIAGAVTAAASEVRRRGQSATSDDRRDDLREAQRITLESVEAEPGLLDPAMILLHASVLLGDGPPALQAWRSYYHVGADDVMPGAIATAGATLHRLLPRLGTERFTAADQLATVEALRTSHMHEAAALLALDPSLDVTHRDDRRVREALAYADFARQLHKDIDEHYRLLSVGSRRRTAKRELDTIVRNALRTLHQAVGESRRFPSSTADRWTWLENRFGSHGRSGATAGYADVHLGHAVVDETRTITQYDHTAELRYVALDHMISNGFQSWAWETGAAHGGWAAPDAMWQVRPPAANGVVDRWRQLQDEERRGAVLEMIERESALDDDRARADPIAHLPGLLGRLQLQTTETILAELRAQGLADNTLRLAFIHELSRSIRAFSIFAHEGRHAIDARIGGFDVPTREYRAKLSQVAFAPRPRIAFGSILSANIGDDTPHGQANARALEGLVAWMDEHADEIAELDRVRPLLPQLDALTDEQMRAAFRSMDPLAR